MDRQKMLWIRIDPRKMLKLKITVESILDDSLDMISHPVTKAILWLMSIAAAFAAGLAF